MKQFGLGILVALVAAGCGGISPSEVVGDWKGTTVNDGKTGEIEQNLSSAVAGAIRLTVKADGTFHGLFLFVPIDGKWKIHGDTIELKPNDKVDVGTTGSTLKVDANGVINLRHLPDGHLAIIDEKSNNSFRFERA